MAAGAGSSSTTSTCLSGTFALAAGTSTESDENKATRPELQGHPVVRELSGPAWWEEGDCVMYEEKEL